MAEVEILLGVYQGGALLDRQLESLAEQSHRQWQLVASDDSRDEDSANRVRAFARSCTQPVALRSGPRKGFAANYLQMIRDASPGYVAFSDQDDVWLPDKLARAMAVLADVPGDKPALYCARSYLWSGDADRRASARFPRAPTFRNALIENIAQGNTIVLNPAATRLLQLAATRVDHVFAHDWWAYLVVTGAGGRVLVDNGSPVILYRQHSGNLIGSGRGALAQLRRKLAVMRGSFSQRLDQNVTALQNCEACLTPENRTLLEAFASARAAALPGRLNRLRRLGLYRQRSIGTLGFWGASLIGRG